MLITGERMTKPHHHDETFNVTLRLLMAFTILEFPFPPLLLLSLNHGLRIAEHRIILP